MNQWAEWPRGDTVEVQGGQSVALRSETKALIYVETESGRILAAICESETELTITEDGVFSYDSDGVVYVKPKAKQQVRQASSDEKFTTLDRPAPMSPEMLAIQRLMKKNELEREKQRERMDAIERRHAAERSSAKVRQTAEKAEDSVRENAERSAPDAQEREGEDDNNEVHTSELSKRQDADERSSVDSNKRRSKRKAADTD